MHYLVKSDDKCIVCSVAVIDIVIDDRVCEMHNFLQIMTVNMAMVN